MFEMKKIAQICSSAILLLLMMLLFATCKKKDDPNPDPEPTDFVIADNVKVLTDNYISNITSYDSVDFTLTFSSWPDGGAALKAGDIVAAGVTEATPYGLLRRITSVDATAKGNVCQTELVKLDEVILQGKIELKSVKLAKNKASKIILSDGVKLNPQKGTDLIGFDLSFEKDLNSSGSAKAYGSLYFEVGFNFSLDVSITPPDVDAYTSIEFIQEANIGIKGHGNWNNADIEIADVVFTPWTFMAGPVPIVFVPKATLKLQADGHSTAQVETFASESFTRELGIKYDEEWSMINEWNPAPTYDLAWPSLQSSAYFGIKCGPEVSLKLYGMAGPYFDLLAKSDLEAELVNNNYNMDFAISLEANAGIDVSVIGYLDFDYSTQLFDKEIYSLHLDNEPIPYSIRITSPVNNSFLSVNTTVPVNISTNGTVDGGVKLYLDDQLKATLTQQPYVWNWTILESEGVHTLKAVAVVNNQEMMHSVTVNVGKVQWNEIQVDDFSIGEQLLATSFSDELHGFAVGTGHTNFYSQQWKFVAKTTDGGLSWEKVYERDNNMMIFDVLALGNNTAFVGIGSQNWYDGGVLVTRDGGASWLTVVNDSAEFRGLKSNMLRITGDGAIVSAWDNEVAVSLGGGADNTWYYSEHNYEVTFEPDLLDEIIDMDFGNGATGYFVTEHGLVYKTTNNGLHWTRVDATGLPYGDGALYQDIELINDNNIMVSGKNLQTNYWMNSILYRSSDGANSFQIVNWPEVYQQSGGAIPLTINDIHFTDEFKGFATGSFGNLAPGSSMLQTVDGGYNWTTMQIPITEPYYHLVGFHFVDARHAVAVGHSRPAAPNYFNTDEKVVVFKYSENE